MVIPLPGYGTRRTLLCAARSMHLAVIAVHRGAETFIAGYRDKTLDAPGKPAAVDAPGTLAPPAARRRGRAPRPFPSAPGAARGQRCAAACGTMRPRRSCSGYTPAYRPPAAPRPCAPRARPRQKSARRGLRRQGYIACEPLAHLRRGERRGVHLPQNVLPERSGNGGHVARDGGIVRREIVVARVRVHGAENIPVHAEIKTQCV